VDGVGVARVFAVAGSGGTTAAAAKGVDEPEGAATRSCDHGDPWGAVRTAPLVSP
jgi:hypothetical protein